MGRYLLTGAAGYVGREVIRQLIEAGEDVLAVDLRDPGIAGITYYPVDITDLAALKRTFENVEIDYILHVASLPGDTGNPRQMVDINVCGCTDMLELARIKQVKRIVVVSSISAYEWYPEVKFCAPDYLPVDEKHPLRPQDMYSSTKQMQEILVRTFYCEYGVPACAIRLAAVVGPNGQGGGRGWRQIAESLAEGKNVQIPHFSLEERCHYVDVRDVARMLLHCCKSDAADGEIFNCCAPHSVTGQELAEIIRKYYPGIEVETGFAWSMAQGGKIAFSMNKARELMGYEPRYDMDASIANIKSWIDAGGLEGGVRREENYGEGIRQ